MKSPHAALRLVAIAVFACVTTSCAFAQDEDGASVIRALYQAHQPWDGKELDLGDREVASRYFAEELVDLLQKNAEFAKACPEGDMCGIGFDPIIAAQDFDEDLRFALRVEPQTPPQAGSYAAHFKLFNQDPTEQVVMFNLVQAKAGWRIADIIYPGLENASLKAQLTSLQ